MGADPVGQTLRPGRLGIGEVRRAQHRDEDLRRPDLAGQPVDDHRHGVAGVIDEQLVAAEMGLAHRHRQLARPGPVELAEPGVAIAVRVLLDVLVPQDRQRDVLALQLAVDARPIGLGVPAMALLRRRRSCKASPPGSPSVSGSGSGQLSPAAASRSIVSRTVDGASASRRAISRIGHPGAQLQTQNLAHLAHANPLCWHRSAPWHSQRSGPYAGQQRLPTLTPGDFIPEWWATLIGTVGAIISEWWATSSRNRWATCSGISTRGHAGDHRENTG